MVYKIYYSLQVAAPRFSRLVRNCSSECFWLNIYQAASVLSVCFECSLSLDSELVGKTQHKPRNWHFRVKIMGLKWPSHSSFTSHQTISTTVNRGTTPAKILSSYNSNLNFLWIIILPKPCLISTLLILTFKTVSWQIYVNSSLMFSFNPVWHFMCVQHMLFTCTATWETWDPSQ